MRDLIKISYFKFLDYIGENKTALQRKEPSITILTYHSVVPDQAPVESYEYRNAVSVSEFEKQVGLLKKIFKVISLDQAFNLLTSGNMTENYAVITFDDGYKNNYDYAFPVLKKHEVSAAFFITTSLIENKNCLWTDWVTYLFLKTRQQKVIITDDEQNFEFHLQTVDDRIKASERLRKWMKSLSREKADQILEQLKVQTKVDTHPVEEDAQRYAFMNWNQVKEMAEQGMEIGSHTHSHSLLTMLNEEQVEQELTISKRLIEEHTGRTCQFFTYPNGQLRDFKDVHIGLLKKLGYKLALTQNPGFNPPGSDLFKLKRINITNKMYLPVFKAYVCGSRKSKYLEEY